MRPVRARVYTLISPPGVGGRYAVGLNLAAYLALRLRGKDGPHQRRRVGFIDLAFSQAQTGKFLNQYTPNVIDLAVAPPPWSAEVIEATLVHTRYNLSVLLGPRSMQDADPQILSATLYQEMLRVAAPLYTHIFVDTSYAGAGTELTRDFALPAADIVIVPLSLENLDISSTRDWLDELTAPQSAGGAGVNPAHVRVILNGFDSPNGGAPQRAQRAPDPWPVSGVLPHTAEWDRANRNCEIVALKNYREITEAFTSILREIAGETL